MADENKPNCVDDYDGLKESILGSKWEIKVIDDVSDDAKTQAILDDAYGICDAYNRKILLNKKCILETDTTRDVESLLKTTLRHEIIHAFFYESGLWTSSGSADNWAVNEEMADWMAIQLPKIAKVYTDLSLM